MPQTEPIEVEFRADSTALVAGADEAKAALQSVGTEAERTGVKFKGVDSSTRSLFRTMVEMRVAAMSVGNVFKLVAGDNELLNRGMAALNAVMDVGIAFMAVYRAALDAKAVMHWLNAKAALAESAAMAGTISFGVGIAIVAAAGLAAFAAITAFNAPKAAEGGIVRPRLGGTLIRVAEAGEPEAIIPLRHAGFQSGMGGLGGITINMKVETNDPDHLVRLLGRRLQQIQNAGMF